MKMKKIAGVLLLVCMALAPSWTLSATEGGKEAVVSVGELLTEIKQYEKKKVSIKGVSVGTCISGGKMWISEGEYKEGAPVILVRAKDDAFKFDRTAVGKEVRLEGFPLAYYADYCSSEDKNDPAHAEKTTHSTDMEGKEGDLKSITFIAESVEYL